MLSAVGMTLLLCGCVQSQWQSTGLPPTQTLRTADQMMDLELTDRVSRLDRLSRLQGVSSPHIEEVVLPADRVAGATRPIPVIRISFQEQDFFNPGSAAPQPQAEQVLQVMAENLRRDVADVRVTVLGHTDATGSEQQNLALSQSRALSVVQRLVADGANPGQLAAVAIGQTQPIAPNATQAGRARNRRVEFLISPSEQANLAVVSLRPVNPAFLALGDRPARTARSQVVVLKPRYAGPADFAETAPSTLEPHSTSRSRVLTLAASGPALTVGEEATGSPVVNETAYPLTAAGNPQPAIDDNPSPVSRSTASYRP